MSFETLPIKPGRIFGKVSVKYFAVGEAVVAKRYCVSV